MQASKAALCLLLSLASVHAFADAMFEAKKAQMLADIQDQGQTRDLVKQGPLNIFRIAEKYFVAPELSFGLPQWDSNQEANTVASIRENKLTVERWGVNSRSRIYCDSRVVGMVYNQSTEDTIKGMCFEIGTRGTQDISQFDEANFEKAVSLIPLYSAVITAEKEFSTKVRIKNNNYLQNIYLWMVGDDPFTRRQTLMEAEKKNSSWLFGDSAELKRLYSLAQSDDEFIGKPVLSFRAEGGISMREQIMKDLQAETCVINLADLKINEDLTRMSSLNGLTARQLAIVREVLAASALAQAAADRASTSLYSELYKDGKLVVEAAEQVVNVAGAKPSEIDYRRKACAAMNRGLSEMFTDNRFLKVLFQLERVAARK